MSRVKMNYQTEIEVEGRKIKTLLDILPTAGPIKMLIVAKTPAPLSVEVGHYFQGRQGTMFWNKLKKYGLLTVPPGKYEDDVLLDHGYGITDIVKVPRSFGNEPSNAEYEAGTERIVRLISKLQPKVLFFVYKRVLDQIILLKDGKARKAHYGFNSDLEKQFGCRVFVFPMPGTPATTEESIQGMTALKRVVLALD